VTQFGQIGILGVVPATPVELTHDRTVTSNRRAEVNVDLTMGERTIDPIDEGFDVAGSRRRPIPVPIVRSLATGRHVLCCSPAYFETLGPLRQSSELADHNCVRHVTLPV
jgi:DNA-binding transcriptional LysR family regulator